MEPTATVAALSALGALGLAALRAAASSRYQREALTPLGAIGLTPSGRGRASGRVDGFAVEVILGTTRHADRTSFDHARIELDGSGVIAKSLLVRLSELAVRGGDLVVAPSTFGGARNDAADPDVPAGQRVNRGNGSILTGDSVFDSLVEIGGSTTLLALLDPVTRRALRELVGRGATVREGKVLSEARAPLRVSEVRELIRRSVELVHLLGRDLDVPVALARNALSDPEAGVRLRNLAVLQAIHGTSDDALGASRAALADPDFEVRLFAALHLGAEGLGSLDEIAVSADADEEVRTRALHALLERGDPAMVTPTLARIAVCGTPAMTIDAIGRLALEAGESAPVTLLFPLLRGGEPIYAAAAAELLGRYGDDSAEPPLLAALDHAHEKVRTAAAEALGAVGTIAAVPLLLELAEGPLKRTARAAIARIQSRLVGAEAGQVSIAEVGEREGALSLGVDAGALSLGAEPTPPEGFVPPRRAE